MADNVQGDLISNKISGDSARIRYTLIKTRVLYHTNFARTQNLVSNSSRVSPFILMGLWGPLKC